MENPVIIFGGGGLGAVALDIFKKNKVVVYGILEDDTKLHGTEIDDVSILGSTDDDGFLKLIGKKCEAFVATDDNKLKKNLTQMLLDRRHVMPVNAIHETVVLCLGMEIGHGNLVSAGVIINAKSIIGNHCIIHSGAVLDRESTIGDYVQVGPKAVIGANVTVGESTFIGSGVIIVPGVKIGKNARIGAGSVVIADVADKATLFGNPAAKV
ncbi:MAG: NeuD/PglB/VioB family sugar acetyltransferase [Bacteroidota bacterium]